MEQYQDRQEGEENFQVSYPVHSYYVSQFPNQSNYIHSIVLSNYTQPQKRIYESQRKLIQTEQAINDEYNEYVNDNYPQYYYQTNQQNIYTNQYYNQGNDNINYNTNPDSNYNDVNLNLRKYESSDGVLRGYTNNYSFYVSGSSKVSPKVTINHDNYINNYKNIENKQFTYNNSPLLRERNGQIQRIININDNQNSFRNYQNGNPSYIIREVEKVPIMYGQEEQQYIKNNYNINYNEQDNKNYYYNLNENELKNINTPLRKYQGPIIQKRIVKRFVDKEPKDTRKDYYIIAQNSNINNLSSQTYNRNNIIVQKAINKKLNKSNNNDFKKKYNGNINERIDNLYQRNYNSTLYSQKRTYTPSAPKNNTNINNYSYLSRQQKLMRNSPNFYRKNSNNSVSYQNKGYPYNPYYTQQNEYKINKADEIYPRYKTPYIIQSPYNDNKGFIYPKRREREYNSKTELLNQLGYEYEFENNENDNEEIYEVPEQYNNSEYNNKGWQNIQNINSNKPFYRLNNFSQTERNGRKYGAYTQTLAMNKNYNDEYEVDIDNRNMRNNKYRKISPIPKVMRPINDPQILNRKNREYSAFERSLKNIRDNEEEIELDNEERNNRVKIKTTGSNNHRLYISTNSKGNSSRKYKTLTELQSNRPEGYILKDIDDDSLDEYDNYKRNINKNYIIKNDNVRYFQPENEIRYRPTPHQYGNEEYEEENIVNEQNMKTHNDEEIDNEEMENNDEEGQMYDSNQLKAAKEGNFGIMHYDEIHKKEIGQNSEELENEIEGTEQEGIIQQINTNINNDEDLYQKEEIPEDIDERIPMVNKNVKNIQTEINEKYYDNQGNYLGEKKIITTKQVPIMSQNKEEYINQKEEGEYLEEQEETENDNEYTPYQSNHKKFKKRGENIKNLFNKDSKNRSYFGDSNNNVYYEIKGEINKESESKNEDESWNKNYKEPLVQAKNITFGIQSENIYVPGRDNINNEEKENLTDKGNNDEKEADEQQIEENSEIEEDEEEQNPNKENNVDLELDNKQNYDNDIINKGEKKILSQKNNNKDNEIKKNNEKLEEEIEKNEYNEEYENNKVLENIKNNNNLEESIDNKNNENIYNENIKNDIIEENIINNNIQQIQENKNIDVNMVINGIRQNIENNNDNNYDENNLNFEENNINENYNRNINDNNFEYNEEEQILEENEAEELEIQNIQKDEGEEEDIGEGLIDMEEEKYNYEGNEVPNGEQGKEGVEEEKK